MPRVRLSLCGSRRAAKRVIVLPIALHNETIDAIAIGCGDAQRAKDVTASHDKPAALPRTMICSGPSSTIARSTRETRDRGYSITNVDEFQPDLAA